MNQTATYTNGLPYRRIQPRLSFPSSPCNVLRTCHANGVVSCLGGQCPLSPSLPSVRSLTEQNPADRITFWRQTKDALKKQGYQLSTLRVYRQVLRSFRTFISEHTGSNSPQSVSRKLMHDFLWKLTNDECSWSWVSTNISVIRTAFDKLSGQSITLGIRSPKRRHNLSDILSENEVQKMLACAPRARDKLLIGLMYGCGLKVSEVVALRWADMAPDEISIRGHRARLIPMPACYKDLIITAKQRCDASDYIFRGKAEGTHLSTRTVERIVKKAASDAKILKMVCCMTLRHSYAVACLKAGENLLQIQLNLGQQHLETTEKYLSYLPAHNIQSAVHPFNHASQIDTTEIDLPFQCEDEKSALYAFFHNLPNYLLLKNLRKTG